MGDASLSQLRQTRQPVTGKSHNEWALTWPDFVQVVLNLTIQAYRAMRQAGIAQRDWEENRFTVCLAADYLRPLAFDHDYSIRVEIRSKVHTQAMKDGTQATIEAKEMDMSLYGIWERDYLNKRFVWEAKRVGDRNIPQYKDLSSEYVHEAIYRFIRQEYADGLDDGGVLAYVLAGEAHAIVGNINQSMGNIRKNPSLPESDHLKIVEPINNFRNIYQSQHIRTDGTPIKLHHLFLTFDFTV
jgi:hypothetical protein